MNKRIYISNKTEQTITLKINSTFKIKEGTMQGAFLDSLNGKRIEPGYITITFGTGRWNKNDEENLKMVLENMQVKKDGSAEIFSLPQNMPIGRGILIPELIVKINELNKL
ncbi:hypothetical protein Y10_14800 [Neptunitalea sp. Y10]|uniref:Uncharacterized protein n=2 Tax=Neptunitalea lumnitzerae TaxID=2965509 RepID=A0ABQ5MI87_9FLAO|nr:hypothetical protein Y10_14800 [Neptunitalea sp. Y10]